MKAQCHCGNVKIKMNTTVESVTSCNCSICNRLGALWGHFETSAVSVSCDKVATVEYSHGDEYIKFHHCSLCGCTTHYTLTEKANQDKIAVNFRMVSADILNHIRVRNFDGADTWEFLSEETH